MKFFQHVEIKERFCFTWLNDEEPGNWFIKTGEGTYLNRDGEEKDLEADKLSRYSTLVLTEEAAE